MDLYRALGAALLVATLMPQQAVFRSRVDIVTVDVTVVDGEGTPVDGLGADRFAVTVDGARRRVIWAEYVARRTSTLHAGAGEHFSSNEQMDDGRLIMIAVDQAHVRRVEGLPALKAAAAFVDALEPRDRVAAGPLNHTGSLEFTGDHASVKRYLQRLTGGAAAMPVHFNVGLSEAMAISDGSRTRLDMVVRRECGEPLGRIENLRRAAENNGMRDPCPVQIEQESRALAQQARTDARISIDALGRLIARLSEIEGPKTLVLVSEGLVAEPQLFDLTALGAAAQAARVTIYVLQLDVPIFEASDSTVSPTMQADALMRSDGLARLAGSARGALFRLVGADPHPFRRILNETSGYYLLGFEAADSDRDGRLHRIGVAVRAPGATVRARPAFMIPPPPPAATESDLVRLLRGARLATELPLRLAAYTFRDAQADRVKIVVGAETDSTAAEHDITIGFVLIDSGGVVVASGSGGTESGRYSVPVTVAPGRYQLRVAAIDAGGRRGSVERRFDARLPADTVQLSDLMLAEPPESTAAPLRPTVVRAPGDRAFAYLEAYAPAGSPLSEGTARFDVVPEGQRGALASVAAAIKNAGSGRWLITAELPLGNLRPGAYSVAASVTLPGGAPRVITRAFVVTPRTVR